MAKTMLSELKSACRAEPSPSDKETIARGVSTWFSGRAGHAPDGTIALKLSDDATVVIAESDVRSVAKDGDLYRVEVSADSNFLLRLEKVMKATVNGGCCKEHRPTTLARDAKKDKGTGGIEIESIEVCTLVCGDFVLGGITFHICVPVNCKTTKM